ncbi:hypothetical protein K439DRAFT_1335048 [Ramaria rubella]|nr:hypothetical protein K439DRAFT_1335048 [Ramaria rubella]
MDMSMPTANSSMVMMMKPYIHFTSGDKLFFSIWSPTSSAAMFGASLSLFAVACFERFMTAFGRVAVARMIENLGSFTSNSPLKADKGVSSGSTSDDSQSCEPETEPIQGRSRIAPPFIPRIELQRGACRIGSALLSYTLMLAVMTFNAGFIIAIVAGLGVGEVLFGRFGV